MHTMHYDVVYILTKINSKEALMFLYTISSKMLYVIEIFCIFIKTEKGLGSRYTAQKFSK